MPHHGYMTTTTDLYVRDLTDSLEKAATALESAAARIREHVGSIRTTDPAKFKGNPFLVTNISDLAFRTLNNSGYVGYLAGAINDAQNLVKEA